MELAISGSSKTVSVTDGVFGQAFRKDLVHQVVNAYRAGGRAGTKAQKTRSEVTGTTKKFKKQKGGGARHGDYRAPIFVGGGVTFAARPRDFSQKVNRKMYRSAIASILSELVRLGRLAVVESFDAETPKTRELANRLEQLGGGRILLVSELVSENLARAGRNIPGFAVVQVSTMDPVSLIAADRVLVTIDAVKKIEEWLA
jgi:large subunit ribosomal protein L4